MPLPLYEIPEGDNALWGNKEKTYFTSLKRDGYPYRLGRKGAIGEWTYVSYWEMHPIIYQLII